MSLRKPIRHPEPDNLNSQCEACGTRSIRLHPVRSDLSYWICKTCGHCLIQSAQEHEQSFRLAQKMYFGGTSQLVQTIPTAIDNEILDSRRRVASEHIAPRDTVLEVGPGAGFFAQWLIGRGNEVHVVEESPVLATLLQQKLNVRVSSGRFETTDVPRNSVNAFCSFHVIEHVIDPLGHLQAGLAAVVPGGVGIIATPNSRSWEQSCFRQLSPNFDPAHLRVFSATSLRKFCEQAGWEVLQGYTPEFTFGWLRVLSKALRRARNEDENATAGQYAAIAPNSLRWLYPALAALTWPLRRIQRSVGGGNEVLLILRKPTLPSPLDH